METSFTPATAARGKGHGRALMQAIESHAARAGAHQMIGGISAENPDGIAFHAALNYTEIASISQAGFKFSRYMDLVLMQKFLS